LARAVVEIPDHGAILAVSILLAVGLYNILSWGTKQMVTI